MKQLLEYYQRRLKTAEAEIRLNEMNVDSWILLKIERLKTKASCYRTFISELERAIKAEEKVNY